MARIGARRRTNAPNGIGLSPDERTLYVANSGWPQDPLLMSYPVLDDLTLSDAAILFDATRLIRRPVETALRINPIFLQTRRRYQETENPALKPCGTPVTGIEEVHKIAGEDCFLVKIRAEGTDELAVVLDTQINPIPTVARVRTTIVLRSILEGPPLSGMPFLSGANAKRVADKSGSEKS